MPFRWSIQPEVRLVHLTWHDPYTFAEWEHAMRDVLAHPAYDRGYNFLVDRRSASPPSAEFISCMANFFVVHKQQLTDVRAALIARDDAGFGMARMTELFVSGRLPTMDIRVFRDCSDAERWLQA